MTDYKIHISKGAETEPVEADIHDQVDSVLDQVLPEGAVSDDGIIDTMDEFEAVRTATKDLTTAQWVKKVMFPNGLGHSAVPLSRDKAGKPDLAEHIRKFNDNIRQGMVGLKPPVEVPVIARVEVVVKDMPTGIEILGEILTDDNWEPYTDDAQENVVVNTMSFQDDLGRLNEAIARDLSRLTLPEALEYATGLLNVTFLYGEKVDEWDRNGQNWFAGMYEFTFVFKPLRDKMIETFGEPPPASPMERTIRQINEALDLWSAR